MLKKEKNLLEIVDFWVINTPPKINISLKLIDIENDITQLIETFQPTLCAIEKLFYFKNQTTIIDVAQSRGVMIHAIAKKGIPLIEYTPLQVKKGISWNGNARKIQVQNALKLLLKLDSIPHPDDAADALALAYIGSLRV